MYFALKIFLKKYIEAKRIHAAHLNLLRNMTHKNFNYGINNNYCQNQNNYEQYNNDKINLFINGQKVHVNNNFNFGVNGWGIRVFIDIKVILLLFELNAYKLMIKQKEV